MRKIYLLPLLIILLATPVLADQLPFTLELITEDTDISAATRQQFDFDKKEFYEIIVGEGDYLCKYQECRNNN